MDSNPWYVNIVNFIIAGCCSRPQPLNTRLPLLVPKAQQLRMEGMQKKDKRKYMFWSWKQPFPLSLTKLYERTIYTRPYILQRRKNSFNCPNARAYSFSWGHLWLNHLCSFSKDAFLGWAPWRPTVGPLDGTMGTKRQKPTNNHLTFH